MPNNTYTLEDGKWRKLLVTDTIEGREALVYPFYRSSPACGAQGWYWTINGGACGRAPSLMKAQAQLEDALLMKKPGKGHCCTSNIGPTRAPVIFTYKNWKGVVETRHVIPRSIWFGTTEHHKQPCWMLRGWDTRKDAERDFKLSDISAWEEAK